MNSQNSKFKNSGKSNSNFRSNPKSSHFSSHADPVKPIEEENSLKGNLDGFMQNTDKVSENENMDQESLSTDSVNKHAEKQTSSEGEESSLLKVQVENLQKEIADWQDKAVRAFADIQNITRQNELDLQQAKKSTKKSLSNTILNFINTLNLAFTYLPENADEKMQQFLNALKLSLNQAIEGFKNQGVEILIPEAGTAFNPGFMNILNSDQIENNENLVVKQVVGVGLKIDNQVIQAASIMV